LWPSADSSWAGREEITLLGGCDKLWQARLLGNRGAERLRATAGSRP
jgi:hypothetical protein